MAAIITSPVTISGAAVLDGTTANFTPGAAFAIKASTDIINAAWGLGNTKYDDFGTKVAAITALIQGMIDSQSLDISPSAASLPTIAEPNVSIPTTIDTSSILATFDAETTNLVTLLAAKVTSCMTTFFPNDATTYATAETWITTALANPSGLPAAVAAQMTSDDQARILGDSTRAQDAVIQAFAARRFPLPPGAAASAILQIQQKAQDGMAESSRKITIASIEQLRWAAEKVLGLRQIAIGAALDYAKTMAQGPSIAAQVTGIGYDAQTKLIGAAAGFYGARTEAAKVVTAASQYNASAIQDAAVKNQTAALTLVEDKVKALMVEIQAIAQIATSLFNNVHASAGSNYSVSA